MATSEKYPLWVQGGGMALHAPATVAMGLEKFLKFYMPIFTAIHDEHKRLKFLTDKYNQCVELMEGVKYKAPQEKEASDESSPTVVGVVITKPKRKSQSRKSKAKKE